MLVLACSRRADPPSEGSTGSAAPSTVPSQTPLSARDEPGHLEVVLEPRKIAGLHDVVQVVVGQELTCARQVEGAVYCWGRLDDPETQTGDPRRITRLDGAHLFPDRDAYIGAVVGADWLTYAPGRLEAEELGLHSLGVAVPIDLTRLERGRLRSRAERICVVRDMGEPVCTTVSASSPQHVEPPQALAGVRDIALCLDGMCTLDAAGSVACGRLEHPERAPSEPIGLPAPAVQLACLSQDSCARLRDGTVHCWTDPRAKNLRPLYPVTPIEVPLRRPAVGLALSLSSACTWSRDGAVECWGEALTPPLQEALQRGSVRSPRTLANVRDAVQVAVGYSHSCLLHASGEVSCWGANRHGEAGGPMVDAR
ncbi:RCC1 domain-containing protein [Nannocystis pusilla]|uniref:RCC1 domain-containing protein n=1 Tax=Nannocystis pusilla TaxID=889268 RepID=A0A9X3F8C8_9BACT|nr:RCC1 domain-containing protein [Nannocystis pusilla]